MSGRSIEHEELANIDCLAFCEQHSIAWLDVMARFNHNTSVYKTALSSFLSDLGRYQTQLQDKGSLSNSGLFKASMHTLKGVASSLGFYNIADTATSIEQRVKHGDDIRLIEECAVLREQIAYAEGCVPLLIELIEREFEQTLNEDTTAGHQLDACNLREELEVLLKEIQSNKMDSMNTLNRIKNELSQLSRDETYKLSTALNNLKFKEAQEIVTNLLVLGD